MNEEELLRPLVGGRGAQRSSLAQAILDELVRRELINDLSVDDFENLAGRGVSASRW